jgi:hypothetical protein
MNKKVVRLLLLFAVFSFSSCDKEEKIVVDDMDTFFDYSFFRGIKPDMYYDDLASVAGEPNEYVDMKSDDEEDHNPIYYFKEGKVMCYWSGSKRDEMGTVVFTPYGNTHIRIDQLIKKNLDEYDITSKTKKIRLYEGDTLYFIISLDNFEIKEVFFLMIKK